MGDNQSAKKIKGDNQTCVELWENIPPELLNVIAEKFKYVDEITRFSAVCKSWNSAASQLNDQRTSYLPHKYPWLLLAEDTGLDISACKIGSPETEHPNGDDQIPQLENIPTTRGFFNLVTKKIYNLDLPEATNKLILGTNKGWLLTLGKDLEINLLHPVHRHQIPLPPMLTFPIQYEYDDDFSPQEVYTMFISKVALSSQVPTKNQSISLQNQSTSHLPTIMTIYERGILACARLGDELWTNVELETGPKIFDDIVYHKKKFYAVNFRGGVFMFDIDNNDGKERQPPKGKMITSIPIDKGDRVRSYMIEALSGSHIWIVLRFDIRDNGQQPPGQFRYYTTNFSVLKLVVHHSGSNEIPSCIWVKDVKDLGNEALFIGRNSSASVASSDCIKPNSIYFTDDLSEWFCDPRGGHNTGGGHDMGIFNVQTGEIQPHFSGISIHRFSPPIWYI